VTDQQLGNGIDTIDFFTDDTVLHDPYDYRRRCATIARCAANLITTS
jgi:hypothetical protein